MDQCHIDPVYKTIWINAKAGTEFFTASTDGMVSTCDSHLMHFQFIAHDKYVTYFAVMSDIYHHRHTLFDYRSQKLNLQH